IIDTYASGGLHQLPDTGGALVELTNLDSAHGESRHASPILLDDGSSVMFTVVRRRAGPATVIGDFATASLRGAGASGTVPHHLVGVAGREAIAVLDDWFLYVHTDGTTILAVPFDRGSGRATGTPVAVLHDTAGVIEGASLANNGTLLYTRRKPGNAPMLVDAKGLSTPLLPNVTGMFMNPRLSPDGRRLAIQASGPQGNDVWVYDIASHTPTRLTSTGSAQLPVWTPAGDHVVYFSQLDGGSYWSVSADGGSPPLRIATAPGGLAGIVTRDGRAVIYETMQNGVWSIRSALLDSANAQSSSLVSGEADSYQPALSPDGRWLAYTSKGSGRYEVYVRSYPLKGGAAQISDAGGSEPVWAGDGRQLYYRSAGHMVRASLAFAPRVTAEAREPMFADGFDGDMPHANYDVFPGGRRLVTIAQGDAAMPEAVVILNWRSELRARLAQK
ncbi:MAG: hypothetical protein ABI969_11875, partial [bacterium]